MVKFDQVGSSQLAEAASVGGGLAVSGPLLIWVNGPFWFSADRRGMVPPEEPLSGKDEPPKPSRLEEALRVIEEYAADLREIIKKLRRRLN
jgi:hypothetical protein